MALQGGHRFAVTMADVFAYGFYALGVERAEDYDATSGRRTPTKDKQTGEPVWTVVGMDRDPEARRKEVKVKVTAPVQPVLPAEVLPDSGLYAVEFSGMTATPYVEDGRGPNPKARLALSFRATGLHPQGMAPGASAGPAPAARQGGHAAASTPAGASGSSGSGDGKAA